MNVRIFKINNMSRETGLPTMLVYRNFRFQRFLERLSVSDHKSWMILQGGILVSSMYGLAARGTMDLDLASQGRTLSEEKTLEILRDLAAIDLGDEAVFSVRKIRQIMKEYLDPGWSLSVDVKFAGKIVEHLQIDMSFATMVTPSSVRCRYRTVLDDPGFEILAFNLETVMAHKFLGSTKTSFHSSRLKDCYDIHLITTSGGSSFSPSVFVEALQNTAAGKKVDLSG